MTKLSNSRLSNSSVARTIVAVATSVLTGATAGAALAHKPLVVPVRRERRPVIVRR